ncbi:hypothetical protein SDC9_49907 [bioreactor metagenome]|uniref:Uncharacterized protein n=1 Tax=bioreactor metagenome TaxID=1076179 RepID=A0A644WIS3_9ZZZZ
MNHKIKHHRNIRATRIELCKTVRLDKYRLADIWLCCNKCRVEAFNMSHLDFHIRLATQIYERIGFGKCSNDRLFDKYMFEFLQGKRSAFVMRYCWSYNIHSIHTVNKFLPAVETMYAKFLLNFCSPFWIYIKKTGQFKILKFLQTFDMDLAEMSGSKYPYTKHCKDFCLTMRKSRYKYRTILVISREL